MNTRKFLTKSTLFPTLVAFIAIGSAGCARIKNLTEDKSYLTPIPQATLDAFQPGQPVETKLQAVIAAQQLISSDLNWIGQPRVIIAETMNYGDALRRFEQPGSASYYDPTPLDTQVWLVVLEGMWTNTESPRTVSAPFTGCAYAVVNAKDGMGMRAGGNSCESLKLGQ